MKNRIIYVPNSKLGYNIEKLDCKQRSQLFSLCREFQPHGNIENVVFLEVIFAARTFCDKYRYPFCGKNKEERFKNFLINKLMQEIKSKYYFNGLKYKNQSLTGKQYGMISRVCNAPKIRLPDFGSVYLKHDSVEKELFMKLVRVCFPIITNYNLLCI